MFYVSSANFVCVLLFLLSSSVAKVYAATFLILPPKTKMMICDFSWISFPPVNFNLINLSFFFFFAVGPYNPKQLSASISCYNGVWH